MIRFEVPLKTESTNASYREPWQALRRKAKAQRARVRLFTPRVPLPHLLTVSLTRVSKGTLDDDNLRSALKHVRDQVACWLGVDDASPLVRWTYAQERGDPAVRIEIDAPTDERPARRPLTPTPASYPPPETP